MEGAVMRKWTWTFEDKLALWFVIISAIAIAFTVWLLYSTAHANPFVCDNAANTCTYRVTATEPTKTKAGLPLTNYKQTNIKTSINGGTWGTIVKPATTVTGGGTVIQDITFATMACQVTQLDVKVSGTNTVGVEGVEAVATGSPVKVDRTVDPLCAPAAPTAGVD